MQPNAIPAKVRKSLIHSRSIALVETGYESNVHCLYSCGQHGKSSSLLRRLIAALPVHMMRNDAVNAVTTKVEALSPLPRLTTRQASFVDGIGQGMSKSDAYRQAYSTENMSVPVVWKEACLLSKTRKVSVWLDWIASVAQEGAKVSVEGHMYDLMRLREAAYDDGQYGAAVSAEKARGQVAGFYDKRATITHISLEELPRTAGKLPSQVIDVTPEKWDQPK